MFLWHILKVFHCLPNVYFLQFDILPRWIWANKIAVQLMMASDDFITLEPSGDSEHQEEENSLHESNSVPSEAECGTSTDLKGVPDGDNLEANEENDEIEEGEHVQDMDLETPEQAFIKENPKLLEETPKEIEPENSPDNVCVHTITEITATNLLIDDSRILLLAKFYYSHDFNVSSESISFFLAPILIYYVPKG